MIEVKHLTKRYGAHTAVSDLNFTLENGRIYGFLGPNGAGKSTTMNIITGCMAATSGDVRIDGLDIYEDSREAKKRIGYLPEQPPLYTDMTPREYLSFVARAKGVDLAERERQVELAMAQTGLTAVADRLIKNLSKGYRQRTGIAQALLGKPEIIILDEPTVGLDPKQMIEIRDLIRSLGQDHTVILSSHILSEVQAVCDYILIISHGKLVASDTPEKLEKKLAGSVTHELEVEGEEGTVLKALEPITGFTDISIQPGTAEGRLQVQLTQTDDQERRGALSMGLCEAGIPIFAMTQSRVSLEDVFLELTADEPKPVQKEEVTDHGSDL